MIIQFEFGSRIKCFENDLGTRYLLHILVSTLILSPYTLGTQSTISDFYGSSEKHTIVSAGLDRTLKLFSPEHESGNRNLGKTTLIHKSNKTEHQIDFIQSFSTSQNRENSWDNLVAVHRDSNKESVHYVMGNDVIWDDDVTEYLTEPMIGDVLVNI